MKAWIFVNVLNLKNQKDYLYRFIFLAFFDHIYQGYE